MKILHVQWSVLGTADIEEAFLAEGYDVVRFPFSKNQDVVHNQKVEEELTTALHKEVPDVVFSFNFFPVISKVCTKEGIQYISWIFDDPCVFLYSDTVTNACNRIYVFDKELMFIDEDSKGTYTISDVYENVVYEGRMREMSHEQMLGMFVKLISCLFEATSVHITQLEVPELSGYHVYNYYEPHMFIIDVENSHAEKHSQTFENITINY